MSEERAGGSAQLTWYLWAQRKRIRTCEKGHQSSDTNVSDRRGEGNAIRLFLCWTNFELDSAALTGEEGRFKNERSQEADGEERVLSPFPDFHFCLVAPLSEQSITGNQVRKGVLALHSRCWAECRVWKKKTNSLITDPLGLSGNSELTPLRPLSD